jgi:hypothetical protein
VGRCELKRRNGRGREAYLCIELRDDRDGSDGDSIAERGFSERGFSCG